MEEAQERLRRYVRGKGELPPPGEGAEAPLAAEPGDVARGLLALKDAPEARQAWGRLLLSGTRVDLSGLDAGGAGEALLEALWDAAYGHPPDPDHLEIAEAVVAGRPIPAPETGEEE